MWDGASDAGLRFNGLRRGDGTPAARLNEVSALFRIWQQAIMKRRGLPAFTLALRHPRRATVRDELIPPRLERAIGVVYRPDSERASHYFHASLPNQFDELIWFDETRAVEPLPPERESSRDIPETFPFGV